MSEDSVKLYVEALIGHIKAITFEINRADNPALALKELLPKLIAINLELLKLDQEIDNRELDFQIAKPIALQSPKIPDITDKVVNSISQEALKSAIKH